MLKNMAKKKMRGFTLIELIAVLVIMAILALIVTPLVMNIIRKARIAADKRSVDAYGRSIELAIAGYLLDTGTFPTSVGELTIEYSGDTVSCTTEQINSDSSVYLAGCTVKNRNVEGYTYGTDKSPSYTAYSIGNHISYNGVTYYVIEDSGIKKSTVKLLKAISLTSTELSEYEIEGIGDGTSSVMYGSSSDYSTSLIKKVVDKWAEGAVKSGDSATARLITLDELFNLGYSNELLPCGDSCSYYSVTSNVPYWVYNDIYWIMNNYNAEKVWDVYGGNGNGNLYFNDSTVTQAVRPVIEISKTADLTKLES